MLNNLAEDMLLHKIITDPLLKQNDVIFLNDVLGGSVAQLLEGLRQCRVWVPVSAGQDHGHGLHREAGQHDG